MSEQATTVKKVEVSDQEINELLGTPGADSILLQEEEKKPNFFSTGEQDLSFLTKPIKKVEKKEEKKEEVKDETKDEVKDQTSVQDILNEIEPAKETEVEDASKGRPKVNKDAAIEMTKKFIEKGTLVPFDDDKKIEDYTVADLEELWEANFKNKEDEIRAKTPIEFFDSLPEKMQYAAKYIADGGTDLKGLFRVLAEVEEVQALSEDVPDDQETIAREYLTVTNFGTPEEITEEITSWKDLDKLATKAEQFKPRLEKMRSEQIAQKLNHQENLKKQQLAAATKYHDSVYETLKPGKLGNIPLDKKVQGNLYTGLTQAQYPSISGRQTNKLGHLLEKYQFVEPDLSKIAQVLWLLDDEEGFKDEIRKQAKNENTEAIVRKLKTEESKKIASSSASEKDEETKQRKALPRNQNFFKR